MEHDLLKKKYDTTRRLCNLRNDDISKLKEMIQRMEQHIGRLEADRVTAKDNQEKLCSKYAQAKELCNIRLEKIYALRARLGEDPDSATETSNQLT